MWLPSISQGHLPGGPNQIMLAETTAAGIGVETGDTIIVEYPIMTGATSVVFVKDTFMVLNSEISTSSPRMENLGV